MARELLALTADKACRFQRRSDGDLYCVAAASSDKSAVGTIDGRRAAPTTRAFCRSCGLPNTDYVCSRLRHIEVAALMTASGVADRRLVDALCDLGRPEVGSPGNCRAGGNACWLRTVEAEEVPVRLAEPPRLGNLARIQAQGRIDGCEAKRRRAGRR